MVDVLAKVDDRLAAIVREIDDLVAERDRLMSFKRTYDEYAGEPAPEKAQRPAPEGEGDAASPSPISVPAREGHAADAGEAARAPASPAIQSTAARKDVPHEAGDAFGESLTEGAHSARDTEAGTQAPPVDTTISDENYSDPIPPETANDILGGLPVAAAESNAERTGPGADHGEAVGQGTSPVTDATAGETATSSHASGKSVGSKGPAAPTLKDRVRALYADHPDWTSGQFAEALPDANYDSVVTTVTTVRKEARQPKVEQPAKPATKTDLIRALHAEHPEMTAREAAKHLGMEIYPLRELTRQAGLAWAPADHRGRPLKVEAERPRATPLVPAPSSAPTGRSSPSAVIVKPMVKPRGTRFHLRNDDGEYLHFSCEAMTAAKAHAWIGDENHLRAVRRKFDLARDLREVAVPKEQAAA